MLHPHFLTLALNLGKSNCLSKLLMLDWLRLKQVAILIVEILLFSLFVLYINQLGNYIQHAKVFYGF